MQVLESNLHYIEQLKPLMPDKVEYIILHHPMAKTASVEDIHQWHLDNGWAGFGYNEYIRKDGTVYIGRGDKIGAHCSEMNSISYGICCEGNFEVEKGLTDAQFNSLIERLNFHKARFINLREIAPHGKFGLTSCPGKYFEMGRVLAEMNKKDEVLKEAVNLLVEKSVIRSPDYWLENATLGKSVKGEFVSALLKSMAEKMKGWEGNLP